MTTYSQRAPFYNAITTVHAAEAPHTTHPILDKKMGQCSPSTTCDIEFRSRFGPTIFRYGDSYEQSSRIVLCF